MPEPGGTRLIGRAAEQRAVDAVLDAVRGARGRALVLLGEPGIGKSALLDHAAATAAASGVRVLRVTGIQSEMELAFAGLHQLLGPEVARVDRLPAPRRAALRVVLGLDDGEPPDRLMVALGALDLLRALAADRPVVCLVDDVQWLDQDTVSVLSSMARRWATDPVGAVVASRDAVPELDGLPRLEVRGLATPDALTLLDGALRAPLDDAVRRQMVAETAGNPLALLELPRGMDPAELAGGFALPGVTPLSDRIEESYRRRLAELPVSARTLLLLAAADPVGEPALLRAAAACLGLGPQAIVPAVEEQLLEIGPRVRFTHPLARSAIYRGASPEQRRLVHLALEEVTDPDTDPDRRAWHRAQAVVGPDDETARQLERSSRRARSRGGLAAATAFLERAASLSPARRARADRLVAAAELAREAGDDDRALALLDAAGDDALDADQAARAALLRGRVAQERTTGPDAVHLLADAARRLAACGLPAAHDAVLDAVVTATWTAAPGRAALVREATSVLGDDRPGPAGPATDLLVAGLRARGLEGPDAALPLLRRALDALLADPGTVAASGPSWSALWLADELWDAAAGTTLFDRVAGPARREGALGVLRRLYRAHVRHLVLVEDVHAARRTLDEGRALAPTDPASFAEVELIVTAWAGEHDTASRLAAELRRPGAGPRTRVWVAYADAVAGNARGDAEGAHRAIAPVFRDDWFSLGPMVLPELADAAARTGHAADLAAAEAWADERARLTATPWSLGVAERVRALRRDGDGARAHYERSVEHLSRVRGRTELARTHLAYGEWLRRRRSRAEARDHLGRAARLFTETGAAGFAERAARELRAVGDHGSGRPGGTLTPQEAEVAALAADGLTNPQIATRLSLSARTVQHHLRNAYAKLGISSRTQLGRALGEPRAAAGGSAAR
ncbi:LuxR family transcriptional regulator [Actinomycetospora chlora]|uniref:LuxR family transcriptional regulator n=1 Tax=Actinomycetospora chlora TaxID=663608 RepID=A0ABP9B1W8_9PSEU